MAEKEEELKDFLMRVKEKSKKAVFKLKKKKSKIKASSLISLWQLEKVEAVTDFILRGSKITMKGYCSHEIKGHLLLGRKTMTNLDSIFKSRDITLPTKVRTVKATGFPVVMLQM